MRTILSIQVQNGMLTETYEVLDDHGDIFVQNVLDAEEGGPADMLHIDPLALRPIGLALLAAADRASTPTDIHAGLLRTLTVVSMDMAGLASMGSAPPASAKVIPWRQPKIIPASPRAPLPGGDAA